MRNIRHDERELLEKFVTIQSSDRTRPDDCKDALLYGISLGYRLGRVIFLLDKWFIKKWWEYDKSLRTGWVTKTGIEALEAAKAKITNAK